MLSFLLGIWHSFLIEIIFIAEEKLKILYDTNPPRQPTVQDRISRIHSQYSTRNFDLLYRNKYESKFEKYKYFTRV
jgi:hypothetical protein